MFSFPQLKYKISLLAIENNNKKSKFFVTKTKNILLVVGFQIYNEKFSKNS